MPQYQYKAADEQGKITQGAMEAANLDDLEMRLLQLRLMMISGTEARVRVRTGGGGKINRQDLILFFFHMEQLTRSGVPLLEGLADMRDSVTKPHFKGVLAAIVQDVQGGKTLSQSMAHYGQVFDIVTVNLIRVGEQTGGLPLIFEELTENLKWDDEIAAKTKKAMMYPAFVGVVVFGLVFFLMIYLVPQLVSFIKNMGGTLPLHTRILIATSNFFVHYWYILLATPPALISLYKFLRRTNHKFHYASDRFRLKIPILGPLQEKVILARFANTFALMYRSGISVLDSLLISRDLANNLVIQEAVDSARQQVGEGVGISAAFQKTGMFPPLVLRMLKVGENTGRLDEALKNISYFFGREVKELIERMQTMIEPIMTVTLGLILGWVMLSVIGPIYDLISKLK